MHRRFLTSIWAYYSYVKSFEIKPHNDEVRYLTQTKNPGLPSRTLVFSYYLSRSEVKSSYAFTYPYFTFFILLYCFKLFLVEDLVDLNIVSWAKDFWRTDGVLHWTQSLVLKWPKGPSIHYVVSKLAIFDQFETGGANH